MGCTSSKAQLANAADPTQTPSRLRQQLGEGQNREGTTQTWGRNAQTPERRAQTLEGCGHTNGAILTAAEKRARAAEAAEARKEDWRQGGHSDPEKARSIAQRREKDDLLAKIYNRYTILGREPPIGLPSCDVNQLRRHLETLR